MRVVFMGTPDFAVGTLEEIIKAGHEVVAVVTQPDKPKGRSGALVMSPVKEVALKHNITVLQPVRARDEAFVEELRGYTPDVIVVVAFGQLLPKSIIDMPPYGCINVHASLLPKYRGAAPIQYAVIDGCEYSGVTTMQMDEGLDTGDILLTDKIKLEPKETGGSLFDRLSDVGAKLLVRTLAGKENGTITAIPQDDNEATYVKMISKAAGDIDFNQSAEVIERLIRGLNPWPSAYTHIDGKMLKIWDADVVNEGVPEDWSIEDNSMCAGKIVKICNDSFYVLCKEGILKINELQLEGKKRMRTGDFLRGYQLHLGTVLGK